MTNTWIWTFPPINTTTGPPVAVHYHKSDGYDTHILVKHFPRGIHWYI